MENKEQIEKNYAYDINSGIISHNYYTYYEDIQNNSLYINKETFELLKKLNISIKETPIQEKKYYQITLNQLNELKKYGYIGQKQLLLKRFNDKEIGICELYGDIFIPESAVTKYNMNTTNKRIKVDDELYIKISNEDLTNLKKAYLTDDIELKLKKLTIEPINKK